jgi:isoquinoline 1-oxidoreductase alpha subunit
MERRTTWIPETLYKARLPQPAASRWRGSGRTSAHSIAKPGMNTTFILNGQSTTVEVDPTTPVLWVLRDSLGHTGTKFGCGMAQCGACTVHLNGQPVRSCATPIKAAAGARIDTIESMGTDRVGKVVEEAWVRNDVAQCGYCQSGQVMSATALLKHTKKPTDAQIDAAMAGNICRCGTYQRVRAAIKDAAASMA